jgi:O-antigen/teichoic acid export membrane protein
MHRLVPIVLNQLGLLGFGVVGIKLVSAYVPVATYKSYALFLTLVTLGYLLTHSGLINHATRYWQREKAQAGAYAWFLWHQNWRLSIPLAGLLLAVALGMSQYEPGWSWWRIFLLLWICNTGFSLFTLANQALNASEYHWRLLGLSLVFSVTRALLPVGMVWLAGATLLALGFGYTVHVLITTAAVLFYFHWAAKADRPRPDQGRRWGQELRDFGRPFVLMGVGAWLLTNADRWIVALCFDEQRAGIFAMSSTIAVIVPTLVAGVLMQGIFPRVFRQADRAQTSADWRAIARRCDQMTVLFLALTLVGLTVLTFLGPGLVPWLLGADYAPALSLLVPTGAALAVATANQFNYLLLQGQHNSASMAKVMAVVAGLKVAGTVLAALVSWKVLLIWLGLSLPISIGLGRHLIHRIALNRPGERNQLA